MQVSPMRMGLWLIQVVALVLLYRTIAIGLGWHLTQDLVADHVKTAFAAMLFTMASHVGAAFYFLGTKRILRETKENLGFDPPENLMRRNKNVIKRTMPILSFSGVFLMVAFVLGGAADVGAISFAMHGAIAISASIVNAVALLWEMVMTNRNHDILRCLRVRELEEVQNPI